MKLLRRISSILLALGLLGGVVYLGILSGRDSKFVIWFGIASAIVAPLGLTLLGYGLSRSNSEMIERLSRVPEIERLVTEAKNWEDKVRVLEAEQARIAEVIQFESRRQAARDRIDSLERDGARIIQQLDNLTDELRRIDDLVGKSVVSEEIERLRQRIRARERGDVVLRLGSRTYRIDRDVIKALPFAVGNISLAYFRLLERVQENLAKSQSAKGERKPVTGESSRPERPPAGPTGPR